MMRPEHRSFAELVGYRPSAGWHDHETHGTTVLALRCSEGVLVLGDRRATMGNLIMYSHAQKIVPLDDLTIVAISGAYARAMEACRFLQHSFKFYARMYLNPMTLDGKLQELSRALAGNMEAALNGGLFLPIVAAYDPGCDRFSIYFFDGAGAKFEALNYAAAGSGSERIRGVFEYLSRTEKPWHERPMEDVLLNGLQMLDIASDLDSATGGLAKVPPAARLLTKSGNHEVDPKLVERCAQRVLKK
jgi:proteasome beta subunit